MNNNTLKCTVVMLPTESKSTLWQHTRVNKLYQGIEAVKDGSQRHLYIISDREIKEDDWYQNNGVIFKADNKFDKGNDPNQNKANKKIEATTDTSLVTNNPIPMKYDLAMGTPFLYGHIEGNKEFTMLLPQIPESFIKKYVESYNNGKVIEDVIIEMGIYGKESGLYKEYYVGYTPNEYHELKVKTRNDNTVIIHPVKDSYTRDEVDTIIMKLLYQLIPSGTITEEKLKEWKIKNL